MTSPLHVVLVHGTWSDGVPRAVGDWLRRVLHMGGRPRPTDGSRYWYQQAHPFTDDLRQALLQRGIEPQVHEPLLWTGANSFGARFSAAGRLAARLQDLRGRTLVIGHSHGGSVAIQALAQLEPARAAEVEVVTLNTPFVRVDPCVSPSQAAGFFAFGMLAFVAHAAARAQASGVGIHDQLALERFTGSQLMWFGLLMTLVLGTAVVLSQRFETQVVRKQVTRFAGARLHCIRGVSDEAGLIISAGLIGAGVGRLAYGITGRLTGTPWTAVPLLLLAMGLMMAVYGVWSPPGLGFVSSVLTWSAWASVALWVLTCLGNQFLGAEFAAVGLLFMGSVDSTPDAARGTIRVDTLSIAQGTADGLRHSAVYLRREVTTLIADGAAPEE